MIRPDIKRLKELHECSHKAISESYSDMDGLVIELAEYIEWLEMNIAEHVYGSGSMVKVCQNRHKLEISKYE